MTLVVKMLSYVPYLLIALGTIIFAGAFVLTFLGYGGATMHDAGPAVGRVLLLAIACYGAAMATWPFFPSFGRGLQAWHHQTHIGDEPMPEWLVRATAVFMVFGGVVTVVAALTLPA